MLAKALYPSAVLDFDMERLDRTINKRCRSHFGLPFDTSTVFLRTELNIMPVAYLIWQRRLCLAPSFVTSDFFRHHVKPHMLHGIRSPAAVRATAWLETALRRAGMSLQDALTKATAADFNKARWKVEMKEIVRRQYASGWRETCLAGKPLEPALKQHLELVCAVRHRDLPVTMERLHPVTGRIPCGLPQFITLGGVHASIGLHFKAFALRPNKADGRLACLWCGEPGCECGVHILTCSKAPARVGALVEGLLERIFVEAATDPKGGPLPPYTRDRRKEALRYTYRLAWPRMTKATVVSTLKTLGRILNHYRASWTGPSGTSNPIRRFDIAP